MSFLRTDDFSGENQLQSAAFSDQARQTLCSAAAGNDAELNFRLTKLRRLCGNSNRASHRCFAAAAEGEAVNRGDHRLAKILDQIEDILSKRARLLRFDCADLCELADIG